MYEMRRYDSQPMYSSPYRAPSNVFDPFRNLHPTRSEFGPYQPDWGSLYVEAKPQYFFKWFSPPGILRTMLGLVALLCFGIFLCVVSTLVWDTHFGYGAGAGAYGAGTGGYGFGAGFGYGSGYYGGSHGLYNYNPTSYSTKVTMIAVAAINFLTSLGFLMGSFSRISGFRSCRFYLAVLIVNITMAFLQGIVTVAFIIAVTPMAQSSQSVLYDPILMMCQNAYGNAVPLYNQYLYHYCHVDPEEAVAMVCSFMAVIAQAVAAYFAQKTRSKIWRHGKPNIHWEKPRTGPPGGRDVEDWVNCIEGEPSVKSTPTVVTAEKAASPLNAATGDASYPMVTGSLLISGACRSHAHPSDQPSRGNCEASSSTSEEAQKPSSRRESRPNESQCETGYTTGEESGSKPDLDRWKSMYPEITSDEHRQEYKRQFDSDLRDYKRLCAEMDDINNQLNTLTRERENLRKGTAKYRGVEEEYNRVKDLKQAPGYRTKKLQSRELREKLLYLKRSVKRYDRGHS